MVATYSAEILNTVQTTDGTSVIVAMEAVRKTYENGMLRVIHGTEVDPKKKKKRKKKRSGRSTADAPIPLGPQTRSGRIHFLFIIASLVDSIDPKLGHYIINKVI